MQTRRPLLSAVALTGALACAVAGLTVPPASAASPTTPFLAEIHYDNAGTDAGEFVEVQIPAGTSSAGLSVVLYNGANGAVYDTDALPVVTAPADAPAVAVVEYPANGIQNGDPDGVALVRGTEVLELLSYEGVFTAVAGPAGGRTTADIGKREAGTEPVGQSLSRTYDAASGSLVWAGPAAATKGAVNGGSTPPPSPTTACDTAPTHEIGAVQGPGAVTPLAGQTVTVRGVVVGDVAGLSGFHLQDRDGDGDVATSDAVFVPSRTAVDLGDTVAVTGLVSDPNGQTQVAGASVAVCAEGTAADLPAAAPLDLPSDAAARERLEGMLVSPVDDLTVSDVFNLTRFGELVVSAGGVLLQPTEVARPGSPEALAVAQDNALRRLVLDDAQSASTSFARRPYLSADTPVRVGDVLDLAEPVVLGFGFGAFRLQPADGSADGVFVPQDTRPAAPAPVGGDLQVGAFNVLNYFLTFAQPLGRGARNAEQLQKQADKIVSAVNGLGADVVTLMEVEDTDSSGHTPGDADVALADLVRRLNADLAADDRWAYVPLPQELYAVDRDVIRNAIIYKQDVVQPVGAPVGLVDEAVWTNAREPQAQTFNKDGDLVTVVANHFKSKGSGTGGDNADAGDGQGPSNGDRVRQAASLAAFAAELSERDPDLLLMGDFNAYTQEDPIVRLHDAGFVDLGEEFDPGRYSYVFDGLSGSLDHALGSATLTAKVTGLSHWSINASESRAFEYTGDPALYAADPYRSSDHDPLVLGIDLDERCQGLVPTLLGTQGDDVLQGTNGVDVVMGLDGTDRVDGLNGRDVVCGGAGDDVLSGGNGDDLLLGGLGDDRLAGGNGDDELVGGPGTDVLDQGRGSGSADQDGAAS